MFYETDCAGRPDCNIEKNKVFLKENGIAVIALKAKAIDSVKEVKKFTKMLLKK
ncbi:MAG: hypothetical protein KAU95_00315 [Candidatus Aenigmarchaeota archaeon]|nr:hypothetical protein [Candidatus Aenigmarchaeota archaeon]